MSCRHTHTDVPTAQYHDAFEKIATPQAWRDWYALYLYERERGSTRTRLPWPPTSP